LIIFILIRGDGFRLHVVATPFEILLYLKPPAPIQIGDRVNSRQLTPRGTFSGGTVSTTFWR
jgi:hypothetical protein